MARDETLDRQVKSVIRRWAWVASIGAVVVGILCFVFPRGALTTVAVLFGIYLIVAGISRVSTALTAKGASGGRRLLVGIVGLLVIAAGVLCLLDPFKGLIAIEIIIGIGWMLDGIISIVMAFSLFDRGSRRALLISGVVSFVLGLIVILIPRAAIGAFLVITAIFLIGIGVVGIIGLAISGARRRDRDSNTITI